MSSASQKQTTYLFGDFSIDLLQQLPPSQTILLIDENVFQYHQENLTDFYLIIIPSGEQHKNQDTVNQIYQELINLEADRSTLLIGIGGGVTSDMVGYVASTYMRGLRFGFVPTTLLAQVDASIGGKNGIDMGVYKNIIGTITQPEFIFFDTNLLQTLPQQEWINGCAEIIKHACIKDKKLFALLQEHQLNDLQKDEDLLLSIVKRNIDIKKSVIEKDPYEKGERRLLNFGHTLGHAIENTYELYHGEAVAIGMNIACQISQHLGQLSSNEVEQIQQLIRQYFLPITYDYDLEKIFSILKMDKKREREQLHLVLLHRIGEAYIHPITLTTLYTILQSLPNE